MKGIITTCLLMAFAVTASGQNLKVGDSRLSPRLLNYQGFLTDTLGNPITNPSVSMTFAIFDAASSGNQKWSETQPLVAVDKGIFHVLLGGVTPIPDSVFTTSINRYLQLTVAGQDLSPRTRIVSAPYAYTATYSDTAAYARSSVADNDWIRSGSKLYTYNLTDSIGLGTSSPNARLDIAASGTNTVAIKTRADVDLAAHSVDDLEFGFVDSMTGTLVTRAMNIVSSGNVGIGTGTDAPLGKLDVANGSIWLSQLGASSSEGIIFGETNSNVYGIIYDGVGAAAENKLLFNTTLGGGTIMSMKGNGLVGIGTASPLCKLDVRGVISGGTSDTVKAVYGGILGGYNNLAGDAADDTAAAVAGGWDNNATAKYSFIGGGLSNRATNNYSTVTGGNQNVASGGGSFVGGGWYNSALSHRAVVTGGEADSVMGVYGGVLSGYSNLAGDAGQDTGAIVVGGFDNSATAKNAAVSGGRANNASGFYSFVGGGYADTASGNSSFVGSGENNDASGIRSSIAGGYYNVASGADAIVSGGNTNVASAQFSTVAGGLLNTASGYVAAVGGGGNNSSTGAYTTVAGGTLNIARLDYSVVGGGEQNHADSSHTTVAGGLENTAQYEFATVSGGWFNIVSDYAGTIGGGRLNRVNKYYGTVGGGTANVISADCGTVPGGQLDTVAASWGFATNYHSVVPSAYTNSAAFNGQTTTSAGQTRVGILSKASGSFTIDHPLDPENKILNHYFVESPEMVLIYRGSAVIEANGKVIVHLPAYFNALNENPMIQLTGVKSNDVWVEEEVVDNTFAIGGKPGIKVYWTVTGARKDPSAEITEILMPVEQVKEGGLAGRSLDDDFLVTTMGQLERMGKSGAFKFRHASEQKRYEELKRQIEESGK